MVPQGTVHHLCKAIFSRQGNDSGSEGPQPKVCKKKKKAFTLIWSGGGKYSQMWFRNRSDRIKVCSAAERPLHPPQTALAPAPGPAAEPSPATTSAACCVCEGNQFPGLGAALRACRCQHTGGGRNRPLPGQGERGLCQAKPHPALYVCICLRYRQLKKKAAATALEESCV